MDVVRNDRDVRAGPRDRRPPLPTRTAEQSQDGVSFGDEGESPTPGGPTYRVISLSVANRGSGAPTETVLQIALPVLPPGLSQPIGPTRTIRPLFGMKDGEHWRHWKDGPCTLGVTFTNNGAVNLEPHISVTLCQIWVPTGWFGPEPIARRYQCRYAITATPAKTVEGVLELDLYELAQGHY